MGSLESVLDFAWGAGDFTSGEAAAATGHTRSTTIDALDRLIARGLLRELPNARAARGAGESREYRKGRPSRRFELRAEAGLVVGLDVGRATLTAAVADLRGGIRAHLATPLTSDVAADRCDSVGKILDAVLALAGATPAEVVAACAGVPAPVDAAGVSPPHPEGFWQRMNPDVVGLLAAWAPLVRVENDASLAAVAEGACGGAAGCGNYVTVLAGERLGAGVVADGVLLRGRHGGAGELVVLDHVDGVGSIDGLGRRIAAWAREAGMPGVGAQQVLAQAEAGEAWAEEIAARAAAVLARLVGLLASVYDPEVVVVSGAVAAGLGGVVERAQALLPTEVHLPAPRLVASRLGGDVVRTGAVMAAVESARSGMLGLPAYGGGRG